jgi:hypothetical protein
VRRGGDGDEFSESLENAEEKGVEEGHEGGGWRMVYGWWIMEDGS